MNQQPKQKSKRTRCIRADEVRLDGFIGIQPNGRPVDEGSDSFMQMLTGNPLKFEPLKTTTPPVKNWEIVD